MDRSKVSSLWFVSENMGVYAHTLSSNSCNAHSFLNLKHIRAFFSHGSGSCDNNLLSLGNFPYASKDIYKCYETGISPSPLGSRSASQEALKPQYFTAPFTAITNNDFSVAFESETFP